MRIIADHNSFYKVLCFSLCTFSYALDAGSLTVHCNFLRFANTTDLRASRICNIATSASDFAKIKRTRREPNVTHVRMERSVQK